MANELLQIRVKSINFEAAGINSYDLRLPSGGDLPPFTAGAHIDVHLPNSLIRSYSLVNSQDERHRYLIAVNKDARSRGGSRHMHEAVRVGDTLTIAHPRNNFKLNEDAPHSLLIAGGIGITPLWCMIRRLEALGRSWSLHYCTRTRQSAAFLDEISALKGDVQTNLHVNFDHEPGGQMLDVAGVVESAPRGAHLYCCGPLPMLEAFEKATSVLPPERVHVEYFTAKEAPATGGGFTVVLAKSGRTIAVPPGKTILDSLLDVGIAARYSCLEGVCATCETAVLEGVPDHRDLVLSPDERASNKVMMICCSGSKADTLVLDL